jgi:TDG/mug DNA glycosylase family protein
MLKPLKDRIQPGVRVLFVGINPGIRSSETGHHFAGYSNRFWKLLYESRLVPERLTYLDDARLPEWRFGITNLVARPTSGIEALRPAEYHAGRAVLCRKIARFKPDIVVLIGVTLYRTLIKEGAARTGVVAPGLANERLAGARLFVLPNPSGRNAHFSHDEMLAAYRALRRYLTRADRQPRHEQ